MALMVRLLLAATVALPAINLNLSAAAAAAAAGPYTTKWSAFDVYSFDKTKLPANVAYPDNGSLAETFPAVVFANSWAIAFSEEYYAVQEQWASQGYVVVSYETRGWLGAGGKIGTAGPDDVRDAAAVVDTLFANSQKWHVDTNKIASAGVSYGAGLASLSGANDTRIKAVLSLSGWGNLTTALYGGDTPSLVWGEILVGTGGADGREPAELLTEWEDLLNHRDVAQVSRWSDVRSPLNYLDAMCGNGRKLPVFVSNNMEDRLFKPDAGLFYRDALEAAGCPTYTLLNQGIHATAELPQLAGLVPNSTVWSKAKAWLDHWLKGAANGITAEPPVRLQLRPTSVFKEPSPYATFESWPPPRAPGSTFDLGGRQPGRRGFGRLEPRPANPSPSPPTSFVFGKRSGLNAGLPIVGEVLQVFVDKPIVTRLDRVDAKHAAVFVAEPFSSTRPTRLCGTPTVDVSVATAAWASRSASNFTLIAYLFDVAPHGATGEVVGTLISHGPQSVWGLAEGAEGGKEQSVRIRLRSLCWDVRPKHSVGFGLDMYSEMYKSANTAADLKATVFFGGASSLRLPLLAPAPASPP